MTSAKTSRIQFFYQASLTLTNRTKLKKFIEGIFRKEKKKLQGLNYIFCTDKQLLAINRQYLKHDFYTDIISFDLGGSDAASYGEIYISVDRVRDNARVLGESFTRELHRVMFHGVLHLCG